MSRLTSVRESEIRAKLDFHDKCKFIDDTYYLSDADVASELLDEVDYLRIQLQATEMEALSWQIKFEELARIIE